MSAENANALMLLAYLGLGVPGLAILFGWGIKRLTTPKAPLRRKELAHVPDGRIHRVLVPLDLATGSLEALQYARAFAKEFDAVVLLLHVVQLNIVGEERGIPRTGLIGGMTTEARLNLTKVIEKLWAEDLSATMAIREGRTDEEILAEARSTDADMIILSTRHRHRLPRFLQRNTVSHVLRKSPCPVLVVGRGKTNSRQR